MLHSGSVGYNEKIAQFLLGYILTPTSPTLPKTELDHHLIHFQIDSSGKKENLGDLFSSYLLF